MSWRKRYPVLVVQAESLGALAVIRSLGRAGYPVHACATDGDAVGLSSRYARAAVVCPPYASGGFLPWLRRYVVEQGIQAIVPSESLLLAIRPVFAEFAPLLACGDDEAVVYAGMSKFDLFQGLLDRAGTSLGDHLPPTFLVEDLDRLPSVQALDGLGTPLYVKVDGAWARDGQPGGVTRAADGADALGKLSGLARGFRRAVVQGHVPGRGVGAFFLIHQGEVLAEFMHRRLHEVPHTGGVSSLRESWRHEAIRDDALAKLRHMRWQGVAMMEYRWDEATGSFALMEMNGRFWGSLHLALFSGVDFPRLLLDAFFGHVPAPVRDYPVGVRCRHTFPGELQHVRSKLTDVRLSLWERASAVGEFLALGLAPGVHSDLLFPGDWQLYGHGLRTVLRDAKGFLRKRVRPASGRAPALLPQPG